jgi:serine/threonine protein kinase
MEGQLVPQSSSCAIADEHSPPAQLGPYRLLQPIGQGGAAVVHLAVGPDDKMLAVKMLQRSAAGTVAARWRLAREVSAMRRIRSPFVAEVIDADVTCSTPYIVTALVEGLTLAEVVADHGPLRGTELQRVAHGLAEGLAAVHAAGIVHRDLKPGNVMMIDGAPVLIDFGIAYQAGDAPLTQTGTFLGTPGYLAPEVIKGQRAQPASDVHAWGTTVGFAARGEPLFGTGAFEATFSRILRADANLDGIHFALSPLIAAALLRQPGQRPTASWLADRVASLDLTAPEPLSIRKPVNPVNTATRPLPARPSKPPWRRIARDRPADFADLLPAVTYVPVRRPEGADRTARKDAAQHPHSVFSFVALVLAVATSFVLPVIGTLAVTAAVTVLRAGNKARTGLAVRRRSRGPRAWDSLLVCSSFPWALARSAIETVVLAPILVVAAGVAVTAWMHWSRGAHPMSVWAAGAAVYAALSCLGPGSRAARRELNRVLSPTASSSLAAVVALLAAGVLTMIVVALVLIQTPPTWPLPDFPSVDQHLSWFNLGHHR